MRPVFGDRRRGLSAAFRTDPSTIPSASELGYAPRPEVTVVDGNWQPPTYHPLAATPRRIETALCVWWHGPPWAILRNASFFLWRVWDHGGAADVEHALHDVPAPAWLRAIEDAVPGEVSRGAVSLWARRFGVIGDADYVAWSDAAHLHDHRPFRGMKLWECVLAVEDAERSGQVETANE